MRWWWLVCCLAGCGRFHFDAVDALEDVDSAGDASLHVLAGQRAYIKPSTSRSLMFFGQSIAVSSNGSTFAIGAGGESSGAAGINGDESNASTGDAGAVYVWTRTADVFAQQAYVKASNPGLNDGFATVALSGAGTTLAVGALGESSSSTGIGGNQIDNSANTSGAVYLYERSGTWSQTTYVKASNTDAFDQFGETVALSADGNTLAVGATLESSNATGIDGNQADNSAGGSGAVYVFVRSGGTWLQQAYVKASNAEANDLFGNALALSADGNTLAIAAEHESSAASGIDGNQADNAAFRSGAVYVFSRTGTTWTQEAYVKASNTAASAFFGFALALSADGRSLAVGAPGETSASRGIDGDQLDRSLNDAGAVYVFTHATGWSQQAYIKASNTDSDDTFGISLTLSADGNLLAVGAPAEASAASGLDGDQMDNSLGGAGAVYTFERAGGTWTQRTYAKASNPGPARFGVSLVWSADGGLLVVSADGEKSAATGLDGDQADQSLSEVGAAYVFE